MASPVGASRQIVEHGTNGFLANTSPEWMQALRALRDSALRARLGAAGRAKAVRELGLPKFARRCETIFTRALA